MRRLALFLLPLFLLAAATEFYVRQLPNSYRTKAQMMGRMADSVETIVLGFPKNMDNTLGERCQKTLAFRDMLERRIGLPVVLWDERLTTWAADQDLEFMGVPKKDRKKVIDQIAAMTILQEYMDSNRREDGQDHTDVG